MIANQNQQHLKVVAVSNESTNSHKEIKQRIIEATLDLNKRYYNLMAEKMSINNADILARFIIFTRRERNIALNTVMI